MLPQCAFWGREQVVFVEDDRVLRVAIKCVLKRCGDQVHEARDGVEVIAFMREYASKIDLVITNMIMPIKWTHQD